MQPLKSVAFFDLDRTLIPFNSGMRYARWEHRAGRLSTARLVRSGLWMVLYHLSLVDMTRAYEKAVGLYKGVSAAELDGRTREWFAAEIAAALLPEAARAISEHKAAGRAVVLLSSTSGYMARVVSERWGFDAWLANEFPCDADGRLTGRVTTPICYGPGKVAHAARWATDHGADLRTSWFYSDSRSDLPMLEAVGLPQVVNPDPRLAILAKRRGWPVHRWA